LANSAYTDVTPVKAVRQEVSKAARRGFAGIGEQGTAPGSAATVVAWNDANRDPASTMYLASRATRVSALSIGARAPCRFTHGRVHSVYRQACNLEADDGVLLTLLADELGNVPHGIRCALPEPADFRAWLHPAQMVAADGLSLKLPEAAIEIDLSAATRWQCEWGRYAIDVRAEATVGSLRTIRAILRDQPPAGGFAPLLLQHVGPRSPLDRAMRGRLTQALPALRRADSDLDSVAAGRALSLLAGLGPGLTPSGDDFIIGYLTALHSRRAHEPMLSEYLNGLMSPIMKFAHAANVVSRQYLLGALEGEVSEALVRVVARVAGADELGVQESAAHLVRAGHSSGADSLSGLLFGLCPAFLLEASAEARRSIRALP